MVRVEFVRDRKREGDESLNDVPTTNEGEKTTEYERLYKFVSKQSIRCAASLTIKTGRETIVEWNLEGDGFEEVKTIPLV